MIVHVNEAHIDGPDNYHHHRDSKKDVTQEVVDDQPDPACKNRTYDTSARYQSVELILTCRLRHMPRREYNEERQ